MFCLRNKRRGTSAPALAHTGLWGSYADEAGNPAIVIANGSGMMKAGFAGEDAPKAVFPTVMGRPRHQKPGITDGGVYFVGDEAVAKRGILTLKYPITNGLIVDWDDMEKIWDHTFLNELKVQPGNYPVLLTEVPLNDDVKRKTLAKTMFEKFNVPKLGIKVDAELALFATGKPTGVVVESGAGVTHIAPVIGGRYLPFATRRMNLAGRDLTDYLIKILMERGYPFTTTAEREIVTDVKEKLCYVALDFDKELEATKIDSSKDANYEMPDGQVITIGSERFRCPEALFLPSLIGEDFGGIHQQTFDVIMKCDKKPSKDPDMEQPVYDAIPVCGATPNSQQDLFANVVLAGGSTMFTGLRERLTKELKDLAPTGMKSYVKVLDPPERKYLKWIGGSMWASAADCVWMTKEDYNELGENVVYKYI